MYCTRREETARVATLLRICLQGTVLRGSVATVKQEEDGTRPKKGAKGKGGVAGASSTGGGRTTLQPSCWS